jgi:hypothetical protein
MYYNPVYHGATTCPSKTFGFGKNSKGREKKEEEEEKRRRRRRRKGRGAGGGEKEEGDYELSYLAADCIWCLIRPACPRANLFTETNCAK